MSLPNPGNDGPLKERSVTFNSLNYDVEIQGSLNSCNDAWSNNSKDHDDLIKPTRSKSNVSTESSRHERSGFVASVMASILVSVRKLQKSVGFSQGFALMVGIIVGSGIFLSPSLVTADVKDVGASLLIWLTCGIIALLGALCYCELGTAIGKAGGNYAFILHIYGPLPAFICSWTQALMIDPTGMAAICLTLGVYVMRPFEDMIEPNQWYPKAIALFCILTIGLTNCLSIKITSYLQTFFTICQSLSIAFIAVLGIWKLCTNETENFQNFLGNARLDWDNIGLYGSAFFGALWAYNGWQFLCNVTEEMIDVQRDLFRTVITAVPFVTISYLIVNVAFFTVLNPIEVGESRSVAVDFVERLFGVKASYVIPPLVALSCYGSASGLMFACGRVSLAAGREGHMPEILGMIHRHRRTPIPSTVLTMVIATLMLIPDGSNLQNLINYASIATWVLCLIVIFGVIVLRVKEPQLERPFKVWLIVPIFMTLIALVLVVIPFMVRPINSAIAIGIILLGIPVYFIFIYFAPKHPLWFTSSRDCVTKFLKTKLNLVVCG